MARTEADREDLFAELKTAWARWELELPACGHMVVAGIRAEERFAIYFGPDVCYQFDVEGRLLRGYVDEFLYRTQGTTLARLHRERTASATQLIRHDLDEAELTQFCSEMRQRLRNLDVLLKEGRFRLVRSVGAEVGVLRQKLGVCLAAEGGLAPAFPTRRL